MVQEGLSGAYAAPHEVAKYLGIGRNTVYRLIASGELEAVRVGGRLWRVPVTGLDRYLEACRTTAGRGNE
jgi:excisionase family DNA binding protein